MNERGNCWYKLIFHIELPHCWSKNGGNDLFWSRVGPMGCCTLPDYGKVLCICQCGDGMDSMGVLLVGPSPVGTLV